MKKIIVLLLFSWQSVWAAELVWSGVGSACGDTLNSCVFGASDNDTIILKTNAIIDEGLVFASPSVSLIAADGYRPTFAAGRGISLYNRSGAMRVEGLTFLAGYVQIVNQAAAGDPASITIINNSITNNGNTDAIQVRQQADDFPLEVNISYNHLNVKGLNEAGIHMWPESSGLNRWVATIHGNTITAIERNNRGIMLRTDDQDGVLTHWITGNVINNTLFGGISLFNQSESVAEMTNYLISNACQNCSITVQSDMLNGGEMANYIYNNTVGGRYYGIGILGQNDVQPMVYHLVNNLVMNTEFGITANTPANNTMGLNENNMFQHVIRHNNYTVSGTNTTIADGIRITRSPSDYHLVSGSPAIDAGVGILAGPNLDADGLPRIKLGSQDVGAYEFGDQVFQHQTTADNYNTQLSHPSINGQPAIDSIHTTQMMTQDDGTQLTNDANDGIWYSTVANRWNIFNQNVGQEMATGVRYNVTHYGEGDHTFEHTVPAEVFSYHALDSSGLNGEPEQIVQLTQHWTGVYNDHPVGVDYNPGTSRWLVLHLDGEVIPMGANFNVYHQSRSKASWVHAATADNTSADRSYISNPIINDAGCAQIQVTQNASGAVLNPHPIGVAFDAARGMWYVANQRANGDVVEIHHIPLGAQFNISVNPEQIARCTDVIFADGF